MTDTPMVEMLVHGGLTQRQAACVERWMNDKMPGGVTAERLLRTIQQHMAIEWARTTVQLRACKARIRELETPLFSTEVPPWCE